MTSRRELGWVGLFAAVSALAASWTSPHRLFQPFHAVPDDAFYYLQIARHLAAGHGFTFDGVHSTNGFHPLWQLVLVPLAALLRDDQALLIGTLLLQVILAAVASMALFTALRPASAIGAAGAVVLLVWHPGEVPVLINGMEVALFMAVAASALHAWRRWLADPTSARAALLVGVCLTLLFLTRLEAFVFTPVAVWMARRQRPSSSIYLRLGLPPVLAATLLLLWWRLSFGLWGTVSGLVKQHWSQQRSWPERAVAWMDVPWLGQWMIERSTRWSMTDPRCAAVHLLVLVTLLALAWHKRAWLRTRLPPEAAWLIGGALLTTAVSKLIVAEHWVWQSGPALLGVAVLAGACWPRGRAGVVLLIAASALSLVTSGRQLSRRLAEADLGCVNAAVDAMAFLRAHGAPPARVGSWNAGLFGYLSGGNVVNLDGLVNDAAFFQQVVLRNDVAPYVRAQELRWLVDYGLGRYGGAHMRDRFELVARFPSAAHGCRTAVSVWRARSP